MIKGEWNVKCCGWGVERYKMMFIEIKSTMSHHGQLSYLCGSALRVWRVFHYCALIHFSESSPRAALEMSNWARPLQWWPGTSSDFVIRSTHVRSLLKSENNHSGILVFDNWKKNTLNENSGCNFFPLSMFVVMKLVSKWCCCVEVNDMRNTSSNEISLLAVPNNAV